MSAFGVEGGSLVTRAGRLEVDDGVAERLARLVSGALNGTLVLVVTDAAALQGSVASVAKHGAFVTVGLDPVTRLLQKTNGRWAHEPPPLSTEITFSLSDAGTRAHVFTRDLARAKIAELYAAAA